MIYLKDLFSKFITIKVSDLQIINLFTHQSPTNKLGSVNYM